MLWVALFGEKGAFFLVKITIFFKNAPINQFWLRKCEKVMFFLDTSTVKGIEWCIVCQNFFSNFFEIFDVFLRFFWSFLSNFKKVNVPVVFRHFYWSQKMIVVAELIHWSKERENLIFDFLRIFPPKLIFLRFFLFFSKNHCSSKLFYYKHFASLYTVVSQTYDLKTNFLLVHHRRHFLIAKSEKKNFFLSNFLIFFQKLAKKSLFNWRQFLYTSKTLDKLVLMQKFSSICSRGLEVMKFWMW